MKHTRRSTIKKNTILQILEDVETQGLTYFNHYTRKHELTTAGERIKTANKEIILFIKETTA